MSGSVEGEMARGSSCIRRQCSDFVLHHQTPGQHNHAHRRPCSLPSGFKGEEACCRQRKGVLSQNQWRMLFYVLPHKCRSAVSMQRLACFVCFYCLVFPLFLQYLFVSFFLLVDFALKILQLQFNFLFTFSALLLSKSVWRPTVYSCDLLGSNQIHYTEVATFAHLN